MRNILIGLALTFLLTGCFSETGNEAKPAASDSGLPQVNAPEFDYSDSGLKKTAYTPDAYKAPAYDPFDNKYRPYQKYEELILPSEKAPNTAPVADFKVRTKQTGLANNSDSYTSGTVKTTFIFDANPSTDAETKSGSIQVRWDFETDGTWDTYFSRKKTAQHEYKTAGLYTSTMQVMDAGGKISTAQKKVNVVNNTAPFAFFTYEPVNATSEKIIRFNTSKSYDSQYVRTALQYRFDWNGDGQWDTTFQKKTNWNHKFNVGTHRVIMEVQDPEGASSYAAADINAVQNQPPVANINYYITQVPVGNGIVRNRYNFDASSSYDPEKQRLQYRWDYNYTGKDDINFDTSFGASAKASGFYDFPGNKTVRLQVRDADGAISEAFVSFVVQ